MAIVLSVRRQAPAAPQAPQAPPVRQDGCWARPNIKRVIRLKTQDRVRMSVYLYVYACPRVRIQPTCASFTLVFLLLPFRPFRLHT